MDSHRREFFSTEMEFICGPAIGLIGRTWVRNNLSHGLNLFEYNITLGRNLYRFRVYLIGFCRQERALNLSTEVAHLLSR